MRQEKEQKNGVQTKTKEVEVFICFSYSKKNVSSTFRSNKKQKSAKKYKNVSYFLVHKQNLLIMRINLLRAKKQKRNTKSNTNI